MKKSIKVGTCGFGRTKREKYFESLPAVEIQHTFYQPPGIDTLNKWRDSAPKTFEFTLKAWQLITHETTSPTYRRLNRELNDTEFADAGFFKPTEIVDDATRVTLECARALKARTLLFQCPARFQPTPENVLNFKRYFTELDRGSLNLAWEPRGKLWDDELVLSLCEELDLWHCVDPFARRSMTPDRCYYRLHGRQRWRYTYEDDEIDELVGMLPKRRLGYVFFNNITMFADAVRMTQAH